MCSVGTRRVGTTVAVCPQIAASSAQSHRCRLGMGLASVSLSAMDASSSNLIVLSNRGPQRWIEGRWVDSAGGLVTALEPVLRRRGGVWISTAESDAAPEPPAAGYRPLLVRIPDERRDRFYSGLANGVLWPALHGFPTIAEIADAPWADYEAVNAEFARVATTVARPRDLVWVHDYHLMTTPLELRVRSPGLRIGWFNHVPWPDADHFAVLPWRRRILDGLLGADVIGFHTAAYASHFLDCAERMAEVRVDRSRGLLEQARGRTRVLVAPIGIPVKAVEALATSDEVRHREAVIRRAVGGRRIILGVDRLDYTKGIVERLAAYGRMLEQNPALIDEVVLVQIIVPSREDVPAYARLKDDIDRSVGQLNGRFARTGRVAIHYLYRSVDPAELYAHYRASDVALITPLRDGMNLVAQEYVAARTQGDGALVLSEFAGAAERLSRAYVVNPHDVDAIVSQLDRALHDPIEKRRQRMADLRATVHALDVEQWANHFLEALEESPSLTRARSLRG